MSRLIRVLVIAILFQAIPTQAASVIKDGNEWLQPANFVDITWDQIDALCPISAARECTGLLGGIDITGFTFASIAEVSALMATYGVPQPDHCGGNAARVVDSVWAPAAFADFNTTIEIEGNRFLEGNVNDANICDAINDPECITAQNGFIGIQSEVNLGDGYCAGEGSIATGAWLYRVYIPAPAVIPTLNTYGLLIAAFGLLLMAGLRLSKKRL